MNIKYTVTNWEYRVLADDHGYCIIEVYLDEHGNIVGWCEASAPRADLQRDLIDELDAMRQAAIAAIKPVLTPADLGTNKEHTPNG